MGLKESGLRGSIRNVSTGIGAAITIDTLEAENVGQDSATIRGEITELTNFGEDAEVFFEWGETTEGLPNTTDIQLQDTVGVFTEDLTNLSEDTTHEFQAFGSVRDVSDEGVVLTFETLPIPDIVENHAVHWYDAQDLSFNDSDEVTTWEDREGNQDLTGGGPIYSDSEIEGNPAVVFDGTDDELGNTSVDVDSPLTIIGVFKLDSAADGRHVTRSTTFQNRHQFEAQPGNDEIWRARDDDIFASVDFSTVPQSDGRLEVTVYDGGDSLLRVNKSEDTGTAAGGDLDGFHLGHRNANNDRYWKGPIGEYIIFDTALTSSELSEVEDWLIEKWDLSI